jgi:hypothetical protein
LSIAAVRVELNKKHSISPRRRGDAEKCIG